MGSEREWKEALEIFLRELFITRMGLSKGYKIVVLDSLLYPLHFRKALLYVLLTRFRFSSVKFLLSESSSLFSIPPKGSNSLYQTGLVVDIGSRDSRVIPVYDGIALLGKLQHGGASSYDVLQRLQSLLLEFTKCNDLDGNQKNITMDQLNPRILENILSQICFTCEKSFSSGKTPTLKFPPEIISCYQNEKQQAQEESNKSDESLLQIYGNESQRIQKVNFPLGGGLSLDIDGYIRGHSTEVLFENTEDYPSVAALILDCLLAVS